MEKFSKRIFGWFGPDYYFPILEGPTVGRIWAAEVHRINNYYDPGDECQSLEANVLEIFEQSVILAKAIRKAGTENLCCPEDGRYPGEEL